MPDEKSIELLTAIAADIRQIKDEIHWLTEREKRKQQVGQDIVEQAAQRLGLKPNEQS
jgi:hypothetical protein